MSILLEAPVTTTNLTKSTHGISKINYILLISAAASIASILLIYARFHIQEEY